MWYLSLKILEIFLVPFYDTKESRSFSSTFDNCASRFLLSPWKCWHLQDIMPHFKLFRHSHSPTEFAEGWLVKIQGPRATFQTCLVQRLGFGAGFTKWCRNRASQVTRQRLTTVGMTHYAAQIQSNFGSLSCEKRTLQSFSSQWPKAKTFSKYDPAFNRPEGSMGWKRQRRGNFWDLNTKLSWQALKEELKEPLYCWTKEGGG